MSVYRADGVVCTAITIRVDSRDAAHQTEEIDVTGIVTGKVGLSGVADAFVALGDPEAHVKIMVEPAL